MSGGDLRAHAERHAGTNPSLCPNRLPRSLSTVKPWRAGTLWEQLDAVQREEDDRIVEVHLSSLLGPCGQQQLGSTEIGTTIVDVVQRRRSLVVFLLVDLTESYLPAFGHAIDSACLPAGRREPSLPQGGGSVRSDVLIRLVRALNQHAAQRSTAAKKILPFKALLLSRLIGLDWLSAASRSRKPLESFANHSNS